MIEEQIEDFLAYINISHSHRIYLSVLMSFCQTAKIRKLTKLIIQTEDLTSTAVCSFQVSETIIFVKEC